MVDPKGEIYNLLTEIDDVTVLQGRPEVIASFPTITFSIEDNTPRYELDKEIGFQDIAVIVDFWADNPVQTASLLETAEGLFRNAGYRLTFSADVPDPEGKARITTRFNLIK